MRKILEATVLILLFVFVSCEFPSDSLTSQIISSPSSNQVWVSKFYTGGIQCDSTSHYRPPDIRSLFRQAEISVVDSAIEPYATCDACGCPTYAAMYYVLINESNLDRAQRLGFRKCPLPWLYVRTGKMNYACTDTVRFTITNFFSKDAYLPACGIIIRYEMEIFVNNQWYDFTAVNDGPCIDLYPSYVKIQPNKKLRVQLPLSDITNLINAKYRFKLSYNFGTDKALLYAYSNPFSITCSSDTTGRVPTALYGSWNWVKSVGGIAGMTITPASAGYTRKVVYNPNMTFESYKNDSLENIYPFSVYYITESTLDSFPVVHYDSLPAYQDQSIYSITNDTLVSLDRCVDCFSHTYVRMH